MPAGTIKCRDLARAADFTVLVAPETTGILARLTREFQDRGAKVLGSSVEAIELTGNKDRLARWLGLGFATPRSRTISPASGLPADIEYPAVPQAGQRCGLDRHILSE